MRRVVFRADASLQIGTGHVMRCLTLAEALARQAVECHFLCREHAGHLIEMIRDKGHIAHVLPLQPHAVSKDDQLAHSAWLGASQREDAQACRHVLELIYPDWLVVDHYALDGRWEQLIRPFCGKLMIIDDLADRQHIGELLLDQTLGREAAEYVRWVPGESKLLCGSRYALLRPEFAALRPWSLKRRGDPRLRRLLISMGGIDKDNVTAQVLNVLNKCSLPEGCKITAVLGGGAPWIAEVRQLAERMPWDTQVLVDVSDMAQLMADSDLAIGAAGATSWERCCLGLPTIMMVLADNQRLIAGALQKAGAVWLMDCANGAVQLLPEYLERLSKDPAILGEMSLAASQVVDGNGLKAVVQMLELPQ